MLTVPLRFIRTFVKVVHLRGSQLDQPLAIVRTVADRQVIVALSTEAAAFGIRATPGMTLTQARHPSTLRFNMPSTNPSAMAGRWKDWRGG